MPNLQGYHVGRVLLHYVVSHIPRRKLLTVESRLPEQVLRSHNLDGGDSEVGLRVIVYQSTACRLYFHRGDLSEDADH